MSEIEKYILENQEIILLALNKLLTPHCKGILDANEETRTNIRIIDAYHKTRKLLGKNPYE